MPVMGAVVRRMYSHVQRASNANGRGRESGGAGGAPRSRACTPEATSAACGLDGWRYDAPMAAASPATRTTQRALIGPTGAVQSQVAHRMALHTSTT